MKIIFNDVSSKEVLLTPLAIASFEIEDTISGAKKSVVRNEFSSKITPRIKAIKYDSVKTISFSLIKETYKDFTDTDQRLIARWLTKAKTPKFLNVITDSDESIYFNGIFTDIQFKRAGSSIVGITCTFTCDSPYSYSEEKTEILTAISDVEYTDATVIVDNVDSDDYIYPKIIITPSEVNSVIGIECVDLEGKYKTMKFFSPVENIPIVFDCRNQLVYYEHWQSGNVGSLISYSVIHWDDADDIYWVKLHDGVNTLRLYGSAEIKIKWRDIKKVPIVM